MRLAVCALSAVLLSGCSWFGGGFGQPSAGYHGQGQTGTYYGTNGRRMKNPCIVYSPTQPIPHGCHPSEVVMANASHGGFPQKPSFGAHTTGGYGSHAADAGAVAPHHTKLRTARKPRLRGALSLGLEQSLSGDIFDHSKVPGIDPEAGYNPDDFAESRTSGSPAEGSITTQIYTADHAGTGIGGYDGSTYLVNKPTISWGDVYNTPMNIKGGFEYIASPNLTAFANATYSYAEGNSGEAITIDSTQLRQTITQDFVEDANGIPQLVGTRTGVGFIPNRRIATFDFNFNDMERYGVEVGGRYYFKPAVADDAHRTITPFVGAAAGIQHQNKTEFEVSQRQLFFERAYENNEIEFYDVPISDPIVTVADSQWIKNGALTVGAEWQVTPKFGMAVESGLQWEEGREYSTGAQAQDRVSIPLTLRGSVNF